MARSTYVYLAIWKDIDGMSPIDAKIIKQHTDRGEGRVLCAATVKYEFITAIKRSFAGDVYSKLDQWIDFYRVKDGKGTQLYSSKTGLTVLKFSELLADADAK
jgi:hypothetical protein